MTGASKCHQIFGKKKRYSVNLPKQEDNPPLTARYLQPTSISQQKSCKSFQIFSKILQQKLLKSFKYAIYIQL
jgi:hypothetical protein